MGTIYNTVNVIYSFFYTFNNEARPQNKYELFNLRHASARNVVERIFGVLKQRFRILLLAPQYSTEIQSRIPAALAALHNFIQVHSPQTKIHFTGNDSDHAPGGFYAGDDSLIPAGMDIDVEEEQNNSEATRRRNNIANDMWRQYQEVLSQRRSAGMADEETDNSESEDLESDEGSDNNDGDIYD